MLGETPKAVAQPSALGASTQAVRRYSRPSSARREAPSSLQRACWTGALTLVHDWRLRVAVFCRVGLIRWGAMRALIVFDVEVFEGVRPGTVFARLLRVAHKGGEFVGWLRHVEALHSVGVFPSNAADVLGPALIHVDGSELRILERVPVSRGE